MDGSTFNALLLADSRVPTGAYAYSSGLEPAIMAGLQTNQVPSYMQARLITVTPLQCGVCVLAHRLAADRAPPAAYARLEQAFDARTPSAAQRGISRTLGRGLLHLAQSLELADSGIATLAQLATPPTRSTVLGVLASALAVDEKICAEACCYEDLQGVAAAALKLLPVTPAMVTRWVLAAGEPVARVVTDARQIDDCAALPAFCAPRMEFQAEAHSLRNRRLFNA